MQQVVKLTIYVFLGVFALTAILSLSALGYLWFASAGDEPMEDLPYLGWLFSIVIAEAVGVVIVVARKGLKYLPEVEINKEEAETLQFMKRFIDSGSSVTIVSNRVAWIRKSEPIRDAIINMARNGTSLEVITPGEVDTDIRVPLQDVGVAFYMTGEDSPPEARFTLPWPA